ncbi:MAG: hypothetical protein ACQUHE_12210 [Bacteroidia bacterium]
MIKKVFIFLAGFLFSCNNRESGNVSTQDSINIFSSVLSSKSFLKGNILYGDSLHFIKSKYYIKSFPESSTYFKLFYIENTDENRELNFSGKTFDKRNRYEITKFIVESDSASIGLYNPGVRESYIYKLKKEQNIWKITKEEALID